MVQLRLLRIKDRVRIKFYIKRNNTSISILFCCVFCLFLLTNSNSCLLKYVYPNDKRHLPCFVFSFLNLSQLAFPTDFYECNRKEYGKIGLKESGKATGRDSNIFLER